MQVPRKTSNHQLLPRKIAKNSNFTVFEIANNFIVGIFLACRIVTEKLSTMEVPQNTLNYPFLNCF